jgi:transcriptional regulator of heat shock response
MNEPLKIKKSDLTILKAYLQSQLLLETLDDVEDESRMSIKHSTKKYKDSLEKKIEQVIGSTFKSNPKMFDEIIMSMRNGVDNINNYFETI